MTALIEDFCLAGWQGENLDAYSQFKDLKVVVANASKCQVVNVINSTLIRCTTLPHVDEELLNDDGDTFVLVRKIRSFDFGCFTAYTPCQQKK